MLRKIYTTIFGLIVFFQPLVSHADLIFSAPPREKQDVGENTYGPLAESIGQLLGEKVIYQHPKDWLTYSRKIRKGDYDLVFDGPQFASWRMVHIQHQPLVRLKGNLEFYIYTKKESDITDINSLVAKKICGLASPNLATVAMFKEFTNPVRQPIFIENKGGFKGVYNAFKEAKCDAALTRSNFYKNKMSDEDRAGLKIIWKSKLMPNQTITASEKIPVQKREQIIAALTSDKGASGAANLFKRFSKKSTRFITTKPEEYEGLNYLLEGVVWGW